MFSVGASQASVIELLALVVEPDELLEPLFEAVAPDEVPLPLLLLLLLLLPEATTLPLLELPAPPELLD